MSVCRLFFAGCGAIALLSADSPAQACRGRPGFAKASVMANAGAMVASDVRSASGGLTVGAREGPFASVAIGYVIRESSETFNTEQTGTSLGASVAYAGTEAGGRLELCPGVGISQLKVSGDFGGVRATLTQNTRRAGVSAGYTWAATPDVAVIPFASVEYVWFGGSVRGDGFDLRVPEDAYYPISIGLGTALGERFGLTAAVVLPTGRPTAHPSFVTSLSAALRRR
jgi:hypothetical protein